MSAANLALLLGGRVPAIRIPGFASPHEMEQLSDLYPRLPARSQTLANVLRVGISQYEEGVRGGKNRYFESARSLNTKQSALFRSSFNPIERLRGYLEGIGYETGPLSEPGWGRYFAGTLKVRSGATPLHVDFAPQDSSDWIVGSSESQLAWNLYLNSPVGGALRVWDRRWQPEDDTLCSGHSFVYSDEVVDGADFVDVPVVMGDVVLINSRNYHAISETSERVTFGSFISLFQPMKLRFWS